MTRAKKKTTHIPAGRLVLVMAYFTITFDSAIAHRKICAYTDKMDNNKR
jgi:hypothetical protein